MTEDTGPRARVIAVWKRLEPLLRRSVTPLIGVLIVAAFLLGLHLGGRGATGEESASADAGQATAGDAGAEAKAPTIWTCSMHPQIRSDHPGKCPICGMDLVPLRSVEGQNDEEHQDRVVLSERSKTLAKINTTEVVRAEASPVEIRLLGRFDYDERRVKTVTSWTSGRIDRLHVAVTGQRIGRGQVIATLYSPEIYTAQQDLIQAGRQVKQLSEGTPVARNAARSALEATRQRLRLLGVPDSEIAGMEKATGPFRHVPIRSEFGGTVIDRMVDEGAYVNPGTGIYRIADLSVLWLQLDAYERDLAYISKGQEVDVTVNAFPEDSFSGKVAFIDPVLNTKTRTTQVRVEVPNRDGRLQPGMFAEAVVEASHGSGGLRPLVIPASAPLFTGRRSIVYVAVPSTDRPTYEVREVRLGAKTGNVYPVVAGLTEGERVVTKGAFTLDADLQIQGGESMMSRADDTTAEAPAQAIPVDPEFTSSLAPLVGSYLNLAERLAADDLTAAQVAARAMERETGRVHQPSSSEARQAWQTIADALTQHAHHAASVAEIDDVRAAFEHLSMQVIELLRRFGNPLGQPLRLVHCPMAFDNRGADWVQRGAEVDNPYFGAAMPHCGEIRATVEAGQPLPAAAAAEGGSPAPTTTEGDRAR